jgi:hypothetical protein
MLSSREDICWCWQLNCCETGESDGLVGEIFEDVFIEGNDTATILGKPAALPILQCLVLIPAKCLSIASPLHTKSLPLPRLTVLYTNSFTHSPIRNII